MDQIVVWNSPLKWSDDISFGDLPPAVPVRIGELVGLFNWRDLVLTEGRFNQVTQSIMFSGTIASLPR